MRVRLVAIAFLVGCGSNSGVDINTDQSNVCDEIAKVACHDLYQCCTESEIEWFLRVSDPRTENECHDDIRRKCARSIASLDFAIDQKHARFDATIMNTCLEALVAPSGTCATIENALPWTEACMNSAWIGLVVDGGSCLSDFECASKDSFCSGDQTCIARPVAGQPCGVSGCATGSFCSAGTCRAYLDTGGACTSSSQCREGLFCDFATFPSVCAAQHARGEPCTSDTACTSNQCNPGTCAGTGMACFSNDNCLGQCADDGSLCFSDGNCAFGTCSIGGFSCFSSNGCSGGSDTCVFPIKCNPGTCLGDVVCVAPHVVVDYCQGALNDLPILPSNDPILTQ